MLSKRMSTRQVLSEKEDMFDWEVRDTSTTPFWQHAVAGSCAGIMEHVAVFPIDTVKTRLQASQGELRVSQAFYTVYRERGFAGLWRGAPVIGTGCIPAHVGLFSTYEYAKVQLLDSDSDAHQPTRAALCGAMASCVHDTVLTPTDTVKQRLQLGGYRGAFDCISSIWRYEGLRGFYRSWPTTLAMNIPYNGVLIAANESMKKILHLDDDGAGATMSDAPWYFLTAGVSGALAAALTVPLDVVKTRLQTQGGAAISSSSSTKLAPFRMRYTGIVITVQLIFQEEGLRGFYRGLVPRIMLAIPSAAVCWGTYETVSKFLRKVTRQHD